MKQAGLKTGFGSAPGTGVWPGQKESEGEPAPWNHGLKFGGLGVKRIERPIFPEYILKIYFSLHSIKFLRK